ncbi:MAG: alpha/beta hydrolase fold domain-containing protein [Rhizobiales bacterium]|nr:alpha/beta hydrolase fold domain-containing protein [Hyphomicrobiales bacterium]
MLLVFNRFIESDKNINKNLKSLRQNRILWLHGGGFIMGQAEDDWFGPLFAELSNVTVVSVEYRLAPEHVFPAALNDTIAALGWVFDNVNMLNIDKNKISIGGASAGAGLAASAALLNRDKTKHPLEFQLLLYPMLDNLHDTESGRIVNHPVWNRQTSLNAWDMYLGKDHSKPVSSYASASRAKNLDNLPAAYIYVGDVDLFYDENFEYYRRLIKDGTVAEIFAYKGMIPRRFH